MFFTTKTGVNVVQFGSGDIEVGATEYPYENIGCVSLMPLKEPLKPGTKINRSEENKKAMTDEDLNVHTRLIFTSKESIDVLIWALKKAKKAMK
jgi:hypothetical protein